MKDWAPKNYLLRNTTEFRHSADRIVCWAIFAVVVVAYANGWLPWQ